MRRTVPSPPVLRHRRRRLRSALSLVFGAEAVLVTRDVCRLDPHEATEVMRWAAATLLAGELARAPGSGP